MLEKELEHYKSALEELNKQVMYSLKNRQSISEVIYDRYHSSDIEGLKKICSLSEHYINPLFQQGCIFIDGSILTRERGRFFALSIDESNRWKAGRNPNNFRIDLVAQGHRFFLRNGQDFEILECNIRDDQPILLYIKGHGLVRYKRSGVICDYTVNDFDLFIEPNTEDELFTPSETTISSHLRIKSYQTTS